MAHLKRELHVLLSHKSPLQLSDNEYHSHLLIQGL